MLLLNEATSIDFSAYKLPTIRRRIERRMALCNVHDIEDYLSILSGSKDEIDTLLNDLLIGVTGFWRDPEAFDHLRATWIPQLLRQKKAGEEVRVWTAGCASGEEAYSLGMIFHEAAKAVNFDGPIRIFATDVHQPTLEKGSFGQYTHDQLKALPKDLRSEYTVKISERTVRISQEIRDLVVFAPHNILTDPRLHVSILLAAATC